MASLTGTAVALRLSGARDEAQRQPKRHPGSPLSSLIIICLTRLGISLQTATKEVYSDTCDSGQRETGTGGKRLWGLRVEKAEVWKDHRLQGTSNVRGASQGTGQEKTHKTCLRAVSQLRLSVEGPASSP